MHSALFWKTEWYSIVECTRIFKWIIFIGHLGHTNFVFKDQDVTSLDAHLISDLEVCRMSCDGIRGRQDVYYGSGYWQKHSTESEALWEAHFHLVCIGKNHFLRSTEALFTDTRIFTSLGITVFSSPTKDYNFGLWFNGSAAEFQEIPFKPQQLEREKWLMYLWSFTDDCKENDYNSK